MMSSSVPTQRVPSSLRWYPRPQLTEFLWQVYEPTVLTQICPLLHGPVWLTHSFISENRSTDDTDVTLNLKNVMMFQGFCYIFFLPCLILLHDQFPHVSYLFNASFCDPFICLSFLDLSSFSVPILIGSFLFLVCVIHFSCLSSRVMRP